MLDIWPPHKEVWVEPDPVSLLHAINDRAINVLLLPEGAPTEPGYEEPQIEAALRPVDRCFLYNPNGMVDHGELSITVCSQEVITWAGTIFDRHDGTPNPVFSSQNGAWLARFKGESSLTQSFAKISVEEALTRL